MSPSVRFEWQHDVVLLEGSQVSLFDDECCQITGAGTYLAPAGASRGLVLKLNVANRTVSLVAQYKHDNGSAAYMGSTQLLSNGNVFIGWGDLPYFSEYSKTGKLLLDAILPGPDLSYRAIQIPHWVGLPTYPPAGAVRDVNGKTVVYASWNGATRVVAWKVLAGPSSARLSLVASSAKSGFETSISVRADAKVFKLEALDATGHVIGTSVPFRLGQ